MIMSIYQSVLIGTSPSRNLPEPRLKLMAGVRHGGWGQEVVIIPVAGPVLSRWSSCRSSLTVSEWRLAGDINHHYTRYFHLYCRYYLHERRRSYQHGFWHDSKQVEVCVWADHPATSPSPSITSQSAHTLPNIVNTAGVRQFISVQCGNYIDIFECVMNNWQIWMLKWDSGIMR